MAKKITYTSPSGQMPSLFVKALSAPHLLIAGETGSGKSVLINGLIATLLYRCPVDAAEQAQMILIDPKRVELAQYSNLPHTLKHAAGFDPDAWKEALQYAVSIMDRRYDEMEKRREKMYSGGDLYVIIDEWANVYLNGGKDCYRAVMRLTSEGRAARVHCIIATQVPKANVLPSEIRENCATRFCLRTANQIQSRVIMDANGCETLPNPRTTGEAQGFYKDGMERTLYRLPYIQDDLIQSLVTYWEQYNKPQKRGLFRKRSA